MDNFSDDDFGGGPIKPDPAAPRAEPTEDSKIVINPHADPLPDNAVELFAEGCLQGMPKYVAYQRFMNPNSPKKEAIALASKLFHRPDVTARLLHLRNEAEKSETNPVTNDELRKVLSAIARSGCPNERISAAKILKDWLREASEAAAAKRIADPALVCEHLAGLRAAAPKMPQDERIEFARQTVAGLSELLHMEPADWQAALIPDRAAAPPLTQAIDNKQDTSEGDISKDACSK